MTEVSLGEEGKQRETGRQKVDLKVLSNARDDSPSHKYPIVCIYFRLGLFKTSNCVHVCSWLLNSMEIHYRSP